MLTDKFPQSGVVYVFDKYQKCYCVSYYSDYCLTCSDFQPFFFFFFFLFLFLFIKNLKVKKWLTCVTIVYYFKFKYDYSNWWKYVFGSYILSKLPF